MSSPSHPIYVSDDDDIHEVIDIPGPEIIDITNDEVEVEPEIIEVGDDVEPENDSEQEPEIRTEEEDEAPVHEEDVEIVIAEEPEAPVEAEPEVEAPAPVTLPPRKRKLAPTFGEEDTMPPPPPKRARAADIVEDDDTSDEEPPSNFEVGGTSQPHLPVSADVEPEDVDPPTLAVRCETYDHQLEALQGVMHAIQEAQYLDD
ncbi:hypothetical protein L1987_40323 [Smallanthus sonchifolius]|uniref:Uncharacterized protein n=2 Tax=Smallanthus sonchifolius TaxID=185202 RepID=A0ACB9FXW4_9ASTR|nr:hypothetical protein L1987_45971 [Smallanthus sonchifolius]KAI3786559.1 hypothetical protein L1987_40323 [Smallanthus sonchifolius]